MRLYRYISILLYLFIGFWNNDYFELIRNNDYFWNNYLLVVEVEDVF